MWKKIRNYAIGAVIAIIILGYIGCALITRMGTYFQTKSFKVFLDWHILIEPRTYLIGAVLTAVIVLLYLLLHKPTAKEGKRIMKKGKNGELDDSPLENSRWMTTKEIDMNFPPEKFSKLNDNKKDGIPLYAVYNTKKRDLDINIASGMHSLIIGATGSGKTTTFVNPMVQILGHSSAGSSMICTDPKGELFQMHSKMLSEKGYKCMVLDLRDPYNSFRWNPLADFYDRYQIYLHTGDEIYKRHDSPEGSGLTMVDSSDMYGETWYEYNGKAYAVRKNLLSVIKVERQKIYDEIYEDLNDLVSVICPIESQNDPVWEKGARSIIMAVCLAMLEDSEFPELEMTRDKY
ncbi:MAG: type IV secretory system conjugative DNA transfer family protein, partial [Lachnospiraceae bacterium]|nr:type IV secretory system conjugative DNA transfer family protein [Lachnospiraceae bacterium]